MTRSYLINWIATLFKGKTPYEILFRKTPSYDNLQMFGCLVYTDSREHRGDKFDSRSRKCVFVGYPFRNKKWTIYNVEKGQIFISRDVIFVEHEFPFMKDVICEVEIGSRTRSNNIFVNDVVLVECKAYGGEQFVGMMEWMDK